MEKNQKNNEIDINELYSIVTNLKNYKMAVNSYGEILKKNPSHSIRESESLAKENYIKALNDFDFFVKNYIKNKEEN